VAFTSDAGRLRGEPDPVAMLRKGNLRKIWGQALDPVWSISQIAHMGHTAHSQ